MKAKKIIGLFFFLSILSSCQKDYISPTKSSPPVVITSTVSYSLVIQPIFNPSCAIAGCHDHTTQAAGLDLSVGNSYNSLFSNGYVDTTKAATSNPLYQQVNSGKMPLNGSKLSSTQIGDILAWITQGAQNN